MTKLLYILSAFVICGSIFYSFQNRKKFLDLRDQRIEVRNSIDESIRKSSKNAADVGDLNGEVSDTETQLGDKVEQVKVMQSDISSKEVEVAKVASEIEGINAEVAQIDQVIKEKLGPITIDELQATMASLKTEVDESQKMAETLEEEIDLAKAAAVRNEEAAKNLALQERNRDASVAKNSFEASVRAVNDDWGFVVINAGQNRGVAPDTSYLVRRGNKQVGRVRVVSVEKSISICDIAGGSMKAGAKILPGDRVILASTAK